MQMLPQTRLEHGSNEVAEDDYEQTHCITGLMLKATEILTFHSTLETTHGKLYDEGLFRL